MLTADSLFFVTEMVGTIAFAASGAMVAIERGLDLFGIIFLGVITAIGGGVIRDILLGQVPPQAFLDYSYLIVAVGTASAVFLWAVYHRKRGWNIQTVSEKVLNVCDAAGLGIFSVIGVQNTISAGFGHNAFFCIFLGMTTGIGGGMLRDMMSRATPMVLRKRIYALASIAGSACYYYLCPYYKPLAISTATILVVVIRLLASHYRWKLPKVCADRAGERLAS